MKVKDLLLTYGWEEIGIIIRDSETEKYLIPHIWKTDYALVYPPTKEFINKDFHIYDDKEVEMWTIENGKIHVFVIV